MPWAIVQSRLFLYFAGRPYFLLSWVVFYPSMQHQDHLCTLVKYFFFQTNTFLYCNMYTKYFICRVWNQTWIISTFISKKKSNNGGQYFNLFLKMFKLVIILYILFISLFLTGSKIFYIVLLLFVFLNDWRMNLAKDLLAFVSQISKVMLGLFLIHHILLVLHFLKLIQTLQCH